MDLDHMNDAEFMAWFEREYPPNESGNRTRYRDTMVMDLMRAAYRAGSAVPAQASAPEVAKPVAWLKEWDSVGGARKGMRCVELQPECETWLSNMFPRITPLYAAPVPAQGKFQLGDQVRKTKGSQWKGEVVGQYSTELNPEGYCVESSTERGSVQIYPAAALELVPEGGRDE